jgi:hypothetical protein
VGNDGHVPNVLRVVHETTDLSAQSVSQPSFPPMSTCGAGPCVRGTYLLDGEAVILLVRYSFNPQTQAEVRESSKSEGEAAATYLTMLAVVLLSSFTKIQWCDLSDTPLWRVGSM